MDLTTYRFVTEDFSPAPSATATETTTCLGAGSYGCVFKPPVIDYWPEYDQSEDSPTISPLNAEDLICKIGMEQHMRKEQMSYDIVYEIDPTYQYHYPKPILASIRPEAWNTVQSALMNCRGTCELYDRGVKKEDLKILVMNYGGQDLGKILKSFRALSPTDYDSRQRSSAIFRQFKTVFDGVRAFVTNADGSPDHRVMHNDIKSDNIVYDERHGPNVPSMRFIDFGLSQTWYTFYRYAGIHRNHFNFPPETVLLNVNVFFGIKQLQYENDYHRRETIIKYHVHHVLNDEHRPWYERFLKASGLTNLHEDMLESIQNYHRNSYYEMINEIIQNDDINYESFMKTYFHKRDSYTVGFTLLAMLNYIGSFVDKVSESEFFELALEMTNFNVFNRMSIEDASQHYHQIIDNMNVVSRGSEENNITGGNVTIRLKPNPTNRNLMKRLRFKGFTKGKRQLFVHVPTAEEDEEEHRLQKKESEIFHKEREQNTPLSYIPFVSKIPTQHKPSSTKSRMSPTRNKRKSLKRHRKSRRRHRDNDFIKTSKKLQHLQM